MPFAPSTVTGAAVTGFTTPTYTVTADTAPVASGKQFAVTSLGGTQTGVRTHAVSSPFTLTWFKEPAPRILGPVGPNNVLGSVPVNKHRLLLRCGLIPLAGQPAKSAQIMVGFDVPAGAELADVAQLKAMVSCLGGYFSANGDNIVANLQTNVI